MLLPCVATQWHGLVPNSLVESQPNRVRAPPPRLPRLACCSGKRSIDPLAHRPPHPCRGSLVPAMPRVSLFGGIHFVVVAVRLYLFIVFLVILARAAAGGVVRGDDVDDAEAAAVEEEREEPPRVVGGPGLVARDGILTPPHTPPYPPRPHGPAAPPPPPMFVAS